MAKKEKKAYFLRALPDGEWKAFVADACNRNNDILLSKEGEYPVILSWLRYDLNGAAVHMSQECQNRRELLRELRWCGECRCLIHKLWETDIFTRSVPDHRLLLLMDDCARRNQEFAREQMDAFFEDPSFSGECEDCPLGGDISDDCAGCAYAPDYHFVNGFCVEREPDSHRGEGAPLE